LNAIGRNNLKASDYGRWHIFAENDNQQITDMEPINRPTITQLVNNVATLLRNGTYTVYDAIRMTYSKLNEAIDWIVDTGNTLADNEEARITAEETRIAEEQERAAKELLRIAAEETRAEAEESRSATIGQMQSDIANLKETAYTGVDSVEHSTDEVILHFHQNGTDDEVELEPASTIQAGVMTAADKSKLDGLPTAAALAETFATKTAATTTAAGLMSATDKNKLDGLPTAAALAETFATKTAATTTAAGLMSAADKNKLNNTKAGLASMTQPGAITAREWLAVKALMRQSLLSEYLAPRVDGFSESLSHGVATQVSLPLMQMGEKLYVKLSAKPTGDRYCYLVLSYTKDGAEHIAYSSKEVFDTVWVEVKGIDASAQTGGVAIVINSIQAYTYGNGDSTWADLVENHPSNLESLEKKTGNYGLLFLMAGE
jgi:hypothetical protein